jgi:hypothetical protein
MRTGGGTLFRCLYNGSRGNSTALCVYSEPVLPVYMASALSGVMSPDTDCCILRQQRRGLGVSGLATASVTSWESLSSGM